MKIGLSHAHNKIFLISTQNVRVCHEDCITVRFNIGVAKILYNVYKLEYGAVVWNPYEEKYALMIAILQSIFLDRSIKNGGDTILIYTHLYSSRVW